MKKRIVICADGTWNKAELAEEETGKLTSTNVSKVAAIVARKDDAGLEQIVLYVEGVGSVQGEEVTGGAFGWGLSRNISLAYKFLCDVYNPDDEIFLFGFSRGAYTVRSLAGLICNSGIVRDPSKIADAVALYREKNTPDKSKSIKSKVFRNQFSHPASVHFIGVWDTVGTLGLPLMRHSLAKTLGWEWDFHDTRFDKKVANAYHAVALDERRSKFQPVLHGTPEEGHNVVEKWFCGVHSDIGGGYRETGLSNITLEWMVSAAFSHGLAVIPNWQEFLGIDLETLPDNLMSANYTQLALPQYERHEEWKGFFKWADRVMGNPDGFVRDPGNNLHESVRHVRKLFDDNVLVRADLYWNDSGIDVVAGKRYRLLVNRFEGVWDAGIPVPDPSGITRVSRIQSLLGWLKRSKIHRYMQLLCTVQRDSSTILAFEGNQVEFIATKSGKLSFFMNDVPWFYWNNRGYATIHIEELGDVN
ncbi:DUF2235 domain-containing protein [Luteolibacter yonseiensis]|uniref:DUF2235 domain-containing protein n=1 Tax=Luteolibacter yonseiensis TaxID=1144680 RepID=A0A934R604_9BACT|nr:DUF2235 domain-containing protein [Luteolibacter yonseiensis]MBK1816613.1 DUF2235 domain-containing protein [Luteolibacter yonseiensis]